MSKAIKYLTLALYVINFIYMLLAVLPAFMCFAFTIDGWFPTESSGTDGMGNDAPRGEELLLFTLSSFLLLCFYSYTIFGPTGLDKEAVTYKRFLTHFILVFIINLITSVLFFHTIGLNRMEVLMDEKSPFAFILLIPLIPLVISAIGIIKLSTIQIEKLTTTK